MITCLTTRLNYYYNFQRKTASHTNVAYTAIRKELLYSGFVLPNVQIFFVQKISFATFEVSIDDFFTRYSGLGYSLLTICLLSDFSCFLLSADFFQNQVFQKNSFRNTI